MGIGAIGVGAVGAQSVQTTDSYDFIVPGSLGSDDPALSSKVAKNNEGEDAQENNSSIGGDKTLQSAVYWGNETVTPTTNIESGDNALHTYESGEGTTDRYFRLGHHTGASTVVDVESSGTWDPR